MDNYEAYGLTVLRADEQVPVWQHTEMMQRVVSARDLHAALHVDARFNDWVKRKIGQHRFQHGTDYQMLTPEKGFYSEVSKTPSAQGGRPTTEYVFSLDAAKIVAMGTNNAIGDRIKHYFLECEKIALRPRPDPVTKARLIEHTFPRIQRENSAVAQRFLQKHGANAAISYHRDTYARHLGVTGAEVKAIGRRAGLTGPDLKNGRAVLRKLEPSLACALSLQDHLILFGVPRAQAIDIAADSHELFDRILETGHFEPLEVRKPTHQRHR